MGNSPGKETETGFYQPNNPVFLQIAVLGDPFVGKTSLCRTYESGRFEENIPRNFRITFSNHEQTFIVQNRKVYLDIRDIPGHMRKKGTWPFCFGLTDGFLLLYDVANIRSFKSLPKWIEIVQEKNQKAPLIIVGARSDLHYNRKVSLEQGKEFAAERNLPFFECSSKTGENVQKVFEELAYTILELKKLVPPKGIEIEEFDEEKEIENYVFSSVDTIAKKFDFIQNTVTAPNTVTIDDKLYPIDEKIRTSLKRDSFKSNKLEEGHLKVKSVNPLLLQSGKHNSDNMHNSGTHSIEKKEDNRTNSRIQDGFTEKDRNRVSSKSHRWTLSEEELLFTGICSG